MKYKWIYQVRGKANATAQFCFQSKMPEKKINNKRHPLSLVKIERTAHYQAAHSTAGLHEGMSPLTLTPWEAQQQCCAQAASVGSTECHQHGFVLNKAFLAQLNSSSPATELGIVVKSQVPVLPETIAHLGTRASEKLPNGSFTQMAKDWAANSLILELRSYANKHQFQAAFSGVTQKW